MCMKTATPARPRTPLAAFDNGQAAAEANIEARLRKRRAGAAADILTSPVGLPSTTTMGGTAQ